MRLPVCASGKTSYCKNRLLFGATGCHAIFSRTNTCIINRTRGRFLHICNYIQLLWSAFCLYLNQVWKAWAFTNHLSSSHPLYILAQVPWPKIVRPVPGVTRGGYARDLAMLIRLQGCSYPRQNLQRAGSLDLARWLESFRVREGKKAEYKYKYIYIYIISIIITSSTAQGGGGSFRIGNL